MWDFSAGGGALLLAAAPYICLFCCCQVCVHAWVCVLVYMYVYTNMFVYLSIECQEVTEDALLVRMLYACKQLSPETEIETN